MHSGISLNLDPLDPVPVKQLASIVGQIISLEMAVGNVVRLMTRSAYTLINSCFSWQERIELDSLTRSEFEFWQHNLSHLNCKQIWPDNVIPSKVVYSDTSAHAYRAILNLDEKIFHTNWSDEEKLKSSTWRELRTVLLALHSFELSIKGRSIAWFTDNQQKRCFHCVQRQQEN